MKMSKLLQMLFGLSFLHMGIVGDDDGGGAGDGDNGDGQGDGQGGAGDGDAGTGEGNKDDKKGGVSDSEAKLLKEVMDKKAKLEKATSELNQVKEQLKKFEGIDAEAVRKLLKEREDAENKQLEAKGEWERLRTRMAEEHGKQVDGLQKQVSDATAALNAALAQINDLSVGNLFGQSKFISEKTTLPPSKARALYASHFEFKDGQVVGYDKPKGAENRTAFVDSMGNALGFDEVMAKLIESDPDKDYLLRANVKPGAGSESPAKPAKPKETSGAKDGVSKIADGLKGLMGS
jgi:hypothetical protein